MNTSAFIALVRSLPQEAELSMQLKDNVLHWKAGKGVHGKIATIEISPPKEKRLNLGKERYTPTKTFLEGLSLAGVAVAELSVQSSGLYGVVLDNRHDDMKFFSSDNTAMVAYIASEGDDALPNMLTLHPKGVELLYAVANTKGSIWADKNTLNYADSVWQCSIALRDPLDHDLSKTFLDYSKFTELVKIDRDRLGAFFRRAAALGQDKGETAVEFGIKDGRLSVVFDEGLASSVEQYDLTDDEDIPDTDPQRMKVSTVARALTNINHIALDYVERGVVVFVGDRFRYIVSTKVK